MHMKQICCPTLHRLKIHMKSVLRALFVILLITGNSMVTGSCSEEESTGKSSIDATSSDVTPYAGSYTIEPSIQDSKLIILANGMAEFTTPDRTGARDLVVTVDSRMLRIYNRDQGTQPVGVFLLSDYNRESEWKGYWDGDIVFLRLILPK